MSKQPMSMVGHMFAASKRTMEVMSAPLRFFFRATGEALDRAIPQGASELASAIHTGSAFVQYGADGHPTQRGGVHGPGTRIEQTTYTKQTTVISHDEALLKAQQRAAHKSQGQDRVR